MVRARLVSQSEAASVTAQAPILKPGLTPVRQGEFLPHDDKVPLASFKDDLERKKLLKSVMPKKDDDEDDEEKKDEEAEGKWDDDDEDEDDEYDAWDEWELAKEHQQGLPPIIVLPYGALEDITNGRPSHPASPIPPHVGPPVGTLDPDTDWSKVYMNENELYGPVESELVEQAGLDPVDFGAYAGSGPGMTVGGTGPGTRFEMYATRTSEADPVQPDDHGKLMKEEVNYRYATDDVRRCGNCKYFIEPSGCKIVLGLIRSIDVCDRFELKEEGMAKESCDCRKEFQEMQSLGFSHPMGVLEVSPPGWEGTVKHLKKHPEIDNPWALAWWMKGEGYEPGYGPRGGKLRAVQATLVEHKLVGDKWVPTPGEGGAPTPQQTPTSQQTPTPRRTPGGVRSMSRLHFQHLAHTISHLPPEIRRVAAEHFADALAGANPGFKQERFLRAVQQAKAPRRNPMFHRAQYKMIADTLRDLPVSGEMKQKAIRHFAREMKGTNPKYDSDRFEMYATRTSGS